MGKGGQKQVASSQSTSADATKLKVWESPYKPLDKDAPELPTLSELKAVIPPHCFERSLLKSCGYLIRDYIFAATIVFVTSKILSTEIPSEPLNFVAWAIGWFVYAFCQSSIMWGLFVMGHECGHGSFSKYKTVNDAIGFVVHHLLLVPYFAWQFSHAKHHRRTNHITDGESHVFLDCEIRHKQIEAQRQANESGEEPAEPVPKTPFVRKLFTDYFHLMGDEGVAILIIWGHLFLGWYVYCMGLHSGGRLAWDGTPLDGRVADHFRPNSPLFPPKLYTKILMDTTANFFLCCGLGYAMCTFGAVPVFLWYLHPYIYYNAWLILVTWLQHTDPSVPHYGPEEWTFVKGALSTIDRSYGKVFDFFHHNIGPTHLVHHVFSEIPFYNQYEATAALKAYLEPKGLYNFSDTPILTSLWHVGKTCHMIDLPHGVQYPITVSHILENLVLSTETKKEK